MFIFFFQDASLRSNYLLLRDLDNNVLKDTLDGSNAKKFAKEKLYSQCWRELACYRCIVI